MFETRVPYPVLEDDSHPHCCLVICSVIECDTIGEKNPPPVKVACER